MPKRDGVFGRKDCAGFYVSWVDAKGQRRKKKVVASTRTQALSALEAIKTRVQQERILGIKAIPDTTVEALFARYLKYQTPRIAPETLGRTKAILKSMQVVLPKQAKDIDRNTISILADTRAAAVKPATVQKEFTVIKHVFRLAVEWELMSSNPAAGVKLPTVTDSRTRYLSPAELKAALRAAPEWMRAPIALAAFTGMRRGELLGLHWTDIDGRVAYVRETRNESMRVVALNELALQVLDSLPRNHSLIFPDVEPHRLTMETRRLFKRLNIAGASFHTLRHTAASLMVMGGAGLFTTGQQLGHKTPRMTARYSHLSPEHMAKAVGTLDAALSGVMEGRDSHGTNDAPKSATVHLALPTSDNRKTRMNIGRHRKTSSRAVG